MIDRENVIKAVEEAFDLVHSDFIGTDDFNETEWEQNKVDALAMLNEQEKPNGKCVNECECWDSAYERGKQDALKEQDAKTQGADSGMCEICSFYERALPVKPVLDEQTGRIWLCGKCGSYVGFEDNDPHDLNEFDNYCRECGRPVLWKVGD